MEIDIKPATVRDVSFILGNLRPLDHTEIFCQVDPDTTPAKLAYLLVMGSTGWVAKIDGQPVAAFGVGLLNAAACSVWAFGTKRMRRTVPAITHFFASQVAPSLEQSGMQIMEARSIVGHHEAHRWMTANGAEVSGEPFPYGRNGEMFLLFRWTVTRYRSIRADMRRWAQVTRA